MLVLSMTFLLSLSVASLVAFLAWISARGATPPRPENIVLGTAMKAATVATIAAMYTAHGFVDSAGQNGGVLAAIAGGLLVVLAIWEKRRRLMIRRPQAFPQPPY